MAKKKLHPSVQKFKEFVKNNPKLIQEVRKGNATWQELYEDWYLLGENDERWETIGLKKNENEEASDEKKADWVSSLTGMMKKLDYNQMQYHLNHLSEAIGAIQGMLGQFQANQPNLQQNQMRERNVPQHPFSFRKD